MNYEHDLDLWLLSCNYQVCIVCYSGRGDGWTTFVSLSWSQLPRSVSGRQPRGHGQHHEYHGQGSCQGQRKVFDMFVTIWVAISLSRSFPSPLASFQFNSFVSLCIN